MADFSATVRIDATPDAVFDAFCVGETIADWFPGVHAVRDVSGPLDRVGATYTLAFTWPVRAHCRVEAVERPLRHRRTFVTTPLRSPGHADVRFRRDGNGTVVEMTGGYALPLGRVGRALDRGLTRFSNRRAQAELDGFRKFVDRV